LSPIESTSTRFRVPDADGSSSEVSRENSCQIVNPPSHTYLVPTSDDEYLSDEDDKEIGIDSSIRGESVNDSLITTPNHDAKDGRETPRKDREASERLDLNLRGPCLKDVLTKPCTKGSSQLYPIDLEESTSARKPVADTESEDEGPDEYPIPHPAKTSGIRAVLNDSPPPRPQRPQLITLDDIDSDRDNIKLIIDSTKAKLIREQEAEKDTNDNVLNSGKERVPLASISDGFDSFDDENDEDDFPADDDDLDPSSPKLKPNKLYHSSPLPPAVEPTIDPSCLYGISESEPLNISAPGQEGLMAHLRAPSPSDAALAKKGTQPAPRMGTFGYDGTSRNFAPVLPRHNPTVEESLGPAQYAEHWQPYGADLYNYGTPAPNQSFYAPGSSIPYTMGPFARKHVLDFPTATVPPLNQEQGRASRSSKIDIESLINDHVINTAQLPGTTFIPQRKRKASQISSDDGQEDREPVSASQQTPLPDAQAQEPLAHTADSVSLQEATMPSIETVRSTVSISHRQAEGPARKKARTSTSSSASGIGKFVSGVCVGVAGVIAAGAAFIATIPATVHEEALREVLAAV